MKFVAVCLLTLTACAVDLETGAASDSVTNCDDWMCGTNSPVIDGFGFHELNVEGVVDSDGWTLGPTVAGKRLGPMIRGSSSYAVIVVNGTIYAQQTSGPATDPPFLSNTTLVGASFVLGHGDRVYLMGIADVRRETPYWAELPNTNPVFESYELDWKPVGYIGHAMPVCAQPNDDDILTMDRYHALVFEGERIDAAHKTVGATLDARWFNIGCAGSTLAKLHLTGHTQAAKADGFSTTILERQTMLKMLSADYCGTGRAFTVGGQPLHWADDHGTMTVGILDNSLEAEWGPNGASCLNTPRVVANPTATSLQYFPDAATVASEIAHTCRGGVVPPPCSGSAPAGTHLWSYNPHPFIILPQP